MSRRQVGPCCRVALPADVGGGACECQMNLQRLQTSRTHKDFLSISGINAKLKEHHRGGFSAFSAVGAAARLNEIALHRGSVYTCGLICRLAAAQIEVLFCRSSFNWARTPCHALFGLDAAFLRNKNKNKQKKILSRRHQTHIESDLTDARVKRSTLTATHLQQGDKVLALAHAGSHDRSLEPPTCQEAPGASRRLMHLRTE